MKNIFEPFLTIISIMLLVMIFISSIGIQLNIIAGRNNYYDLMDEYSEKNLNKEFSYSFAVDVPLLGRIVDEYTITGVSR